MNNIDGKIFNDYIEIIRNSPMFEQNKRIKKLTRIYIYLK